MWESKVVENLECDVGDDYDDNLDYDEARTKHEPESTQDHEQAASSVLGISHSNTLNFYHAESEHTQLANNVPRCRRERSCPGRSSLSWLRVQEVLTVWRCRLGKSYD